jgi:DNA-binding NarL/FixJ family response regulator
MPVKLLIYEDNDRLRASLEALFRITPDILLQAAFPNCLSVQEHVGQYAPDVVIMDIEMPGISGIEGVKQIKEINPDIQVVMYTVFDDDTRLFDCLCAGADGYLLKQSSPQDLIQAVRDVSKGGAPMAPSIARKVIQAFAAPPPQSETFCLSNRELEILHLLVKGFTYKKIADTSHISIDTVRKHLQNIYAKLQVNCGTEAVAKALQHRIISR